MSQNPVAENQTKKVNLSEYNPDTVPSGEGLSIGVVVAEWNSNVTASLLEGAVSTLKKYGVTDIRQIWVPGSYELTHGAQLLFKQAQPVDAVICLGCVIQGETRHFDFICEAVSQGLTNLSLKYERPVIFGLLTTNDMQQALDRSGGRHGNKGVEGAITALKMCHLQKQILSE